MSVFEVDVVQTTGTWEFLIDQGVWELEVVTGPRGPIYVAGEPISHTVLTDRSNADQHPSDAITVGAGTMPLVESVDPPADNKLTTILASTDATIAAVGGEVQMIAVDLASHDHAASEIVSGTVAAARLGSGTADSTTFLRGDSAWAAPPGGSPITEVRVPAVMFVGSNGQAVAPTVRSIGSSAVRSRLGIVMADSVSTSTWATIPSLPWTSVDVYLDLFNLNASTGGVRWQVYLGEQATTHAAMTAYLATIAVSSAASGDDLTYGTRWTAAVATSVAVTQSSFLSASVTRLGADAADTLAGSVYFAALRFRQAGT